MKSIKALVILTSFYVAGCAESTEVNSEMNVKTSTGKLVDIKPNIKNYFMKKLDDDFRRLNLKIAECDLKKQSARLNFGRHLDKSIRVSNDDLKLVVFYLSNKNFENCISIEKLQYAYTLSNYIQYLKHHRIDLSLVSLEDLLIEEAKDFNNSYDLASRVARKELKFDAVLDFLYDPVITEGIINLENNYFKLDEKVRLFFENLVGGAVFDANSFLDNNINNNEHSKNDNNK